MLTFHALRATFPCAARNFSMRCAQLFHALRATFNGVEATPSENWCGKSVGIPR
jgi:hypothetical protein